MTDSKYHPETPFGTVSSLPAHSAREDGMDDEEKILAGRFDVNMPALLTRDVQGG